MSSTEIHSAISRPRPALKQYHQLVHGLNSLLVWFQHRVWSADGAVCDDINTMPNWLQNGWIGRAIFTSSMHLLAPPWQKALPVCTVLVWCCGGCGTGATLVAAFAEVAKMSVQCIDDPSYTKQPNKYY
jgi:hypothetical protein